MLAISPRERLIEPKTISIYNWPMTPYRSASLDSLWFLIALNAIIFLIEFVTGEGSAARSELIPLLGLTPALLPRQPWTILSSMFVHATWWHIIVNMVSLYFLGSFLLRAVGERNFLAVFFAGGLMGNICYVAFGPSLTTAVGASGAIYALGGTLAVLAPTVPVLVFPIPMPVPLWAAIVIFLFISFLPGIAWQAHLGGLLLGLVAGVLLRRGRRIYFF